MRKKLEEFLFFSNLSEGTRARYSYLLDDFFTWIEDHEISLMDLNRSHYKSYLYEKNWAVNTRRLHLSRAEVFFELS